MICATFKANRCKTIISCNSPTNASGETDITTIYNELFSFVRHIANHNILIIGDEVNAQIGHDENNKFYL